MLPTGAPDPCQRSACQPVDISPAIEAEGFTCTTIAECDSCVSDSGCLPPSDTCENVHCEANKCVTRSKVDFSLATCAFSDPFPGDELSTDAHDCAQFTAANESACGPTGSLNKPRALCKLWKLEGAARSLLQNSCSADGTKPKASVMKRIVRPLRQAIFQGERAADAVQAEDHAGLLGRPDPPLRADADEPPRRQDVCVEAAVLNARARMLT